MFAFPINLRLFYISTFFKTWLNKFPFTLTPVYFDAQSVPDNTDFPG